MTETAPLRAFLVDDEPLALERLERLLASFPELQIAGKAHDPEEAVSALNIRQVDVLFLDIQMPGMNGFELKQVLDERHTLPVIMITARSEPDLREKAMSSGAACFLRKPFDTETLVDCLEKALGV